MKSGHTYAGTDTISRGTPIVFMLASSILILAFTHFFREKLMHWGFALQSKQISVDEDLPNYFKTITLQQADEISSEYKNMKSNYGIEIHSPKFIQLINKFGMPKKIM